MDKFEKIQKLQQLKENGTLTETEFESEKQKVLQSKNKTVGKVIVLLINLIAITLIIVMLVLNNKKSDIPPTSAINNKDTAVQEETKSKPSTDNTSNTDVIQTSTNAYRGNVSFANMNSLDSNLEKVQQEVVRYFDNDYFLFDATNAQLYPQVFKGAKVSQFLYVVKVLQSTDDTLEVLAVYSGDYNYYRDAKIDDIPEKQLVVISAKQLNERLIKNDGFMFYGVYNDVISKEIDGKTYMVSSITANEIVKINEGERFERHSFKVIKDVAEYIFGKDIKVNKAVAGQDYDETYDYSNFYKITLDNQANSNFKVFNIYNEKGMITYNKIHNDISSNIQKRLFLSADFQHYIVSTYDEDLKYVYIDYFDRDFKKVWSREFQYASTKSYISPIDYTQDKMAFVIDNDLYLVDINTGKNIIEPVLVGEKIKVNMMSDGIVLVGDNNKDTVMKVDYTGKILFRLNADTSIPYLTDVDLQIVNNKIVLLLMGTDQIDPFVKGKYMVINGDGNIEILSEDIELSE